MKSRLYICVLLAGIVAGCGKSRTGTDQKPTNASSANPLTAPADYAGAVVQSKTVAEKVVDMASLKRAIQMFQASEERYPNDLNELVRSGYIPALPKPPSGMKFDYNPSRGEVRLVPAQ